MSVPINLFVLVTVHLVLSANSSSSSQESCLARTPNGVLLGKLMTSRSGRVFSTFLGIPYAAPPIGNLRFLPPSPPKVWEGVRNSTEESDICLQRGFLGSEDCLYLNIFTHTTEQNVSSPVMVYIHGGGFYLGSSSTGFLGPEYFMDRDIVLVTLQYRLGAFGFLSLEDGVIPGNMGLKDQVRALQWVQENIKAFGGDPGKVTIFGNSVGGASVHFHMQSPLSRNLFQRGISQSGTALSGFALAGKGICRNITEHMAMSLNCSNQTSTDILRCLQQKSSQEIVVAYNKQVSLRYDLNKILFRPVVEVDNDHAVITRDPITTMTDKPWLLGVNTNEGILKVTIKKFNETLRLFKTSFNSLGPQLLFFDEKYKNPKQVANLMYDFYFKNASSINDTIKSIEQLVTDNWFVFPTEQAIQRHNGSLYYYLYDHNGEHSVVEYYGCVRGFGISHTDELIVLFTHKSIFPELNEVDSNVSKLMVDFWVNFATTGNPTPNSISRNPQTKDSADFVWESSNTTDPVYLHIQTNKLSMKNKLFYERMNFWREILKEYST